MIESIEISGCASYGDTLEEMKGLEAINFVYGSNGAGKTTISRLIADGQPTARVRYSLGARDATRYSGL